MEVYFEDSSLLEEAACILSSKNELNWEEIDAITESYRIAWKLECEIIINSIEDILGFKFRQEEINLYIIDWPESMSSPLIINTSYKNDEFSLVLTHELLHILLNDNSINPHSSDVYLKWHELFNNKDYNNAVYNHIPVFAILKKIWVEVLHKPEILDKSKEKYLENGLESYIKAWKYVDDNDYNNIIELIKIANIESSEN